MSLLRYYFDLIVSGAKTIEVRVAYPKNEQLAASQLLRFTSDGRSLVPGQALQERP